MATPTISPQVWTVYRVTNIANGRPYIGVTKRTLKERWRSHVKDAYKRRHTAFGAAIRKYGPNSFVIDVLGTYPTRDLAIDAEIFFIERHKSRRSGYNMTPGGNLPAKVTTETRAKMRASHLGKKRAPHSLESKQKIGAAQLGKKKRPMSWANRTKMTKAYMMKGSPWTPECYARLIELYKAGVSYHEIAAELGLTRGQIAGKLDRAGITNRISKTT